MLLDPNPHDDYMLLSNNILPKLPLPSLIERISKQVMVMIVIFECMVYCSVDNCKVLV